jgi:hypothetical protein
MESVNLGKDVTLLFDYNNLVIRSFFGSKEITEDPDDIQWGLWRYNVFNSIYTTLWKFRNVTEVILAVDDYMSWRKHFYSRYKESRKIKKKKDSKVDWETLYSKMHNLASELKHHMPFKVIKVKNAEADDVIAVLAREFKNPCVIIARDEDYFQLFGKKKNLIVFDPIKQKLYSPDDFENIREFLLKLIFCGQKKDDIPNIITPDDWGLTEATEGKRRPGFGEKAFEKIKDDVRGFIEAGHRNKVYGLVDLSKNLKRNRILVDFDKIPNTICNRIADAYNNSSIPPLENIYLFFEKYGMMSFLENYHRVEQKLQELT